MDEQENLEQMQPDEFDLDDILNEFRVEPEENSEEPPVLPEEQPVLPEEEPEEAAADQLAPELSLEEPEPTWKMLTSSIFLPAMRQPIFRGKIFRSMDAEKNSDTASILSR